MKIATRALARLSTILAAVGLTMSAEAAEEGPFSFSIGGGAEYDSNITVDEQDLTTGEGDGALVFEGDAALRFGDRDRIAIEAGYDFFQSLHSDLTNFDLQIHGLSLTAERAMGAMDGALSYRYSHIRLGGDGFLDIHGVEPSVGYLLSDSLYILAAYEYQDRDFNALDRRDGTQHNGRVDAYYFFGADRYVNLGYRLVRETTVGPEFTFWGHAFGASVKFPVSIGGWRPEWRARYRYYEKDYSNVTPSIGAERSDERHNISTSLRFPLTSHLYLIGRYEFIDSDSNLPSIDYREHIVGGSVEWAF